MIIRLKFFFSIRFKDKLAKFDLDLTLSWKIIKSTYLEGSFFLLFIWQVDGDVPSGEQSGFKFLRQNANLEPHITSRLVSLFHSIISSSLIQGFL